MSILRLSKPALALGLAALLVTACGRKPIVIQNRRADLAPRSDTRTSEEVPAVANRRAELQAEVARRQTAYAVKIGGEKFAPGARKTGEGFKGGAIAGRDPDRR